MLTILGTGLVGIRQTTPTAILHLTGPNVNTVECLNIDSNMINGTLNVVKLSSDVSGADDLIFRITATGTVFADGAYTGTGADYAEWFEKEEGELKPKDLVGLNFATGKVRKYQPKDLLVGVYAEKPGFVGNQPLEISEAEMSANHALVSLLGQVEVAQEQISLQDRIVYTLDGIQLGYLLANGKVFIKISL